MSKVKKWKTEKLKNLIKREQYNKRTVPVLHETLYEGYTFGKVLASRYINVYADKREKQSEVLITNYDNPKEKLPSIEEK